jgi:hypothetical protein
MFAYYPNDHNSVRCRVPLVQPPDEGYYATDRAVLLIFASPIGVIAAKGKKNMSRRKNFTASGETVSADW